MSPERCRRIVFAEITALYASVDLSDAEDTDVRALANTHRASRNIGRANYGIRSTNRGCRRTGSNSPMRTASPPATAPKVRTISPITSRRVS